jgi:hypothetical protein
VIGVFRHALWLNGGRARAYAIMLVVAMAVAGGIAATARSPAPTAPRTATDFVVFYASGDLALHGHAADAYDRVTLDRTEHRFAAFPGSISLFYPPILLLLCAVIAALPYGAAWVAFCAAGFVPLLLALRRVLPQRWALLPLLTAPCLVLNAASGQSGFLSAACFAGAAALLDGYPVAAGACLGGLVFKPHLALAVPVALLLARRWRALAACAAMALALCVLSLLVFGVSTWHGFLQSLSAAQAEMGAASPDWRKQMTAFTEARFLGMGVGAALWVQALGALAALTVLARVAMARPGGRAEMAVLAAATLLVAPHVMDYDLVVMLIPGAWIAASAQQSGWRPWEKSLLAVLYVFPLAARALGVALAVQPAPLLLAGLLAITASRAMAARATLLRAPRVLVSG